MERWVQLDSPSAFSLSVSGDLLGVGCADGIIRLFRLADLSYLSTLPLPTALPSPTGGTEMKHPAVYALRLLSQETLVVAVYADRSLILWDISDQKNIRARRSFQFHRAGIWDIQMIQTFGQLPFPCIQPGGESGSIELHLAGPPGYNEDIKSTLPLPPGSFVTCSADNSICFWNLGLPAPSRVDASETPTSHPLSHHLIQRIELSVAGESETTSSSKPIQITNAESVDNTPWSAPLDLSTALPDPELPDRPSISSSPRALAVHPSGLQLAVGDRS
eukprot:gene2643-3199_t